MIQKSLKVLFWINDKIVVWRRLEDWSNEVVFASIQIAFLYSDVHEHLKLSADDDDDDNDDDNDDDDDC